MAKFSPTGKPLCSRCKRLATYRIPGHDRITDKTFYVYQCDNHAIAGSELLTFEKAGYQFELGEMQKVLIQLNELTPLPIIGTEEARAHPAEWLERHKAIMELEDHAKGWALLSVPFEVRTLLEQIRERRRVLLNMQRTPGTGKVE